MSESVWIAILLFLRVLMHWFAQAFAFTSSVKAKRLQSRATEKEQKRLHVPTIDRNIGEPAPFVIVVQGPPQVCVYEILSFLLSI